MSFSIPVLSTELQNISGADEASTIVAWGDMWATYFAGAVAGSGPGVAFTGNPTHITTAKNAMTLAMSGMCSPGAAPVKIQDGIVAWWVALAANPANYFAGASSVTAPSGLTSIGADMAAVFSLNMLETTKPPACDRLATFFDTKNAGGVANISGSKTIA